MPENRPAKRAALFTILALAGVILTLAAVGMLWAADPVAATVSSVTVTEPRLFMPVIADHYDSSQPPPPMPTATATAVATPTSTPTPIPIPLLKNGNFEAGPNGDWEEYVNDELALGTLILQPGGAVPPRSGAYVAWLGGLNNETNEIRQVIEPTGRATLYLRFWYQIRSDETSDCEGDFAGAIVNGQLVATYGLCANNETTGWVKESVKLSSLIGQKLTISFVGSFDNAVLSSFFVDDVSLGTTP